MTNKDFLYHLLFLCRKKRLHSIRFSDRRQVSPFTFSLFILSFFLFPWFCSCSRHHEHIAEAVNDKDSLPFMTSHGVSNLISDSGIISYKIVAEDWFIYNTEPSRWTFLKGLFLEKFDSTFHVQWHVQSDTAYCHNNRIWELRGRVVVLNREGDLFETEELFWDMDAHQLWNTVFMTITKPNTQQQLQGYNFRSNEQMTEYHITNSAGYTPMGDDDAKDNNEAKDDNAPTAPSATNRRSQQPR